MRRSMRRERAEGTTVTRLRPISTWLILLAVVVIVAVTVPLTIWLYGIAGNDPAPRIEAIKTGLTVAAGTGGFFALLLAFRRQRATEIIAAETWEARDREYEQRDQAAKASERDAEQRRITDLYTRAADQLGSEKAPVRLAGLHALERLAQTTPAQRQTIVDVICAYLRMPYTPSAESFETDNEEQAQRREELQVRFTAQRILAAHLRDEAYRGQRAEGSVPETFWPDIRIDLRGAHLVDFFFGDCRVVTAEFHHATFLGEAVFRGLHCDLAFFQSATFSGRTDFRGAVFPCDALFSYATFDTDVWFHADEFYSGTRFGRYASFRHVTFAEGARFGGVTFAGSVEFFEAHYGNGPKAVDLKGAYVEDPGAMTSDVSKAPPISWPPGWVVEPRPNGKGILTWSAVAHSDAQRARRRPRAGNDHNTP